MTCKTMVNMNRINEIGDTVKGQEMLGRTAERAYQRANKTSGADKNRYMKTYNDAYRTGGKSANKHLGGSREHFDNGRDYEHEKWADEHNGNVTESKTMNRKLIRLTESDLHKIVKESVNKILKESNYNNYFDWANRSGASDDEIEAAGQRHDSRIPSIKEPTDKLARREKVFNKRASMNNPDMGERIANRKDFIKNQREGNRFRQGLSTEDNM